MPITNGSITVGTATTLITTCGVNPGTLHISNLDNTDAIFVGGSTVAVNAGHTIPKSGSEDFVVYAAQQMFAVSSKSNHTIAFTLVTA